MGREGGGVGRMVLPMMLPGPPYLPCLHSTSSIVTSKPSSIDFTTKESICNRLLGVTYVLSIPLQPLRTCGCEYAHPGSSAVADSCAAATIGAISASRAAIAATAAEPHSHQQKALEFVSTLAEEKKEHVARLWGPGGVLEATEHCTQPSAKLRKVHSTHYQKKGYAARMYGHLKMPGVMCLAPQGRGNGER